MKLLVLLVLAPVAALALAPRARQSPAPLKQASSLYRSPSDLALSADGKFAVTANRTTGTLSVVDLEAGTVLRELTVGTEPFGVALSPDGRSVAATCLGSDTLAIAPLDGSPVRSIPVGDEPRGVVLSPDGKKAFVALAGEDAVAEVDVPTGKVTRRIAVDREPWHLALSDGGKKLVVGCTRGRSALVLDAQSGKTLYSVPLAGRNVRKLAVSADGKWAYVPFIAERLAGATRENIDRGWVVGNRLGRVPLSAEGPREAITLDSPGDGVADVEGIALSKGGQSLALCASGTHELVLLSKPDALNFVAYGGPGDHSENATRRAMRRIRLGGAPKAVRFTPDGKLAVVANYLDDTLQLVDVASGKLTKTIALGAKGPESLAREGEALFLDANRSFGGWYSCASCHTEGHTNGGLFDTLNDGGYGKPKKTPSLRGVAQTAPYTWHGWQKSLKGAIHDSFVNSMQGPEPSSHDVEAVEAYLKTLAPVPSPQRKTTAARRGETVFKARACDSCHGGASFTSASVGKVGLEEPDDEYVGFNPPSLRAVRQRAPYLHDGRAETLEDVLKTYHRPSRLTGKPDLSPAELSDLVAYLKTL